MIFSRDKSRPSKEEERRITQYFEQYDTPELKIHDRLERQEKIKNIHKLVNKLPPLEVRDSYIIDKLEGGINYMEIAYTWDLPNEYWLSFNSINSKAEEHGIELLTLNQLEYVEKAIKEWKK